MLLDITNHAIDRWNERFYGCAPNIIEAFNTAKRVRKKELDQFITGRQDGVVFFGTAYCLFVCKETKLGLRIVTTIPRVRKL